MFFKKPWWKKISIRLYHGTMLPLQEKITAKAIKATRNTLKNNPDLFKGSIDDITLVFYSLEDAIKERYPFTLSTTEPIVGHCQETQPKSIQVTIAFKEQPTKAHLRSHQWNTQLIIVVEHELTHAIDTDIWDVRRKVRSRYKGRPQGKLVTTFLFIARTEGVARFAESQPELDCRSARVLSSQYPRFLSYLEAWDDADKKTREKYASFFTNFIEEKYVYDMAKGVGLLMCYAIAFAQDGYKRNDICINALRKQEDKIPAPQFSRGLKQRVIKQVKRMEHLRFLREYEKAAEKLHIGKDDRVLTREAYDVMKKLAYLIDQERQATNG